MAISESQTLAKSLGHGVIVLFYFCFQVPWGDKAFKGYLGSVEAGKAYDATELMKSYKGPQAPILIDQGTADGFLAVQLKPENFMAAAAGSGYKPVALNMRPLYDHSYYFISTFMRDHVDFHARALLCFPAHSECKSLY